MIMMPQFVTSFNKGKTNKQNQSKTKHKCFWLLFWDLKTTLDDRYRKAFLRPWMRFIGLFKTSPILSGAAETSPWFF